MYNLDLVSACITVLIDLQKVSNDIKIQLSNESTLSVVYNKAIANNDQYLRISQAHINKFNIPKEAINWATEEDNFDVVVDILVDKIGKFPYYLGFGFNPTPADTDGYKICADILDIVASENTVFSLAVENEIPGKALSGIATLSRSRKGSIAIIGLTYNEYEQLLIADSSKISQFVKSLRL